MTQWKKCRPFKVVALESSGAIEAGQTYTIIARDEDPKGAPFELFDVKDHPGGYYAKRFKILGAKLPSDPAKRKAVPLCSGVLDYFPDALAAVAECSRVGNEQHNPGEPLHWAKEKSTDEADALLRHLVDRGKVDTDGVRHSAKVAWRALALLQREIESEATKRQTGLGRTIETAQRTQPGHAPASSP